MQYRQLGTSGLRISVLTMGAMTFGGKGRYASLGSTGLDEAKRQIDQCVEAGVNLIDTATRRSSPTTSGSPTCR
jgi:aryl-alcohol dehydrogenase-like predicted oxidoreductase